MLKDKLQSVFTYVVSLNLTTILEAGQGKI